MRNISSSALATITTAKGIEPINIVAIYWKDTPYYYSDRITDYTIGKILELSNLENVINITKSSSSQSISLRLDDTDGSIKNIYDYNDIHKRVVKVYQWFSGLDWGDKFLIFEGEISSPIVWNEASRTLSFEVVSRLEDKEVGFSVEEGEFDAIPHDLIGKAWPLPFGTCAKIPCLQLDPIPRGITTQGTGITDPSLTPEINRLVVKSQQLNELAVYMFLAAVQAYSEATRVGDVINPDKEWENIGDQYTEKGNEYLAQSTQVLQDASNLRLQKKEQDSLNRGTIGVLGGDGFPQGQSLNASLNGAEYSGQMAGNNFKVNSKTHPSESNQQQVTTVPLAITSPLVGNPDIITAKDKFFWVAGGSNFRVTSTLPVRYIVSMIPVTVLNVFAYRNFGDARSLLTVPSNYYTVYNQSFGSVTATMIEVNRPLSSYDQGWDDSLYVDVQSSVGPNTVDIIAWLISTYTSLSYDPTSFSSVHGSLAPFPSNFCLFSRKNIVQLLSEICYQARCAIWLKEGVFYIRYLPVEPSPVETISEDDVIAGTLEVTSTTTEDIRTKLTAEYQVDYENQQKNKIIIRNNVPKYGTQEEGYDWYIYNTPELVLLASTYWLIHKSNTWKLIRFRTPLTKLRIETFDPITIEFSTPFVATESVTGIVEAVSFDSSSLELTFSIWLPVRLGEMNKYIFAWLVDNASLVYPSGIDLVTAGSGGPGENAGGSLLPANNTRNQRIKYIRQPRPGRGDRNPGRTNPDTSVAVIPGTVSINTDPAPTFNYNYRNYTTTPFTADNNERKVLPGKIIEGDGPEYKVKVYPNGLSGQTRNIKVKCVNHTSKLAPNTWISVITIVWKEKEQGSDRLKTKVENVFVNSQASSCFPAMILSGTENLYQVRVYKSGTSEDYQEVEALQLQIATFETIPPNTWTLVAEVATPEGLRYYMQLPVWLE